MDCTIIWLPPIQQKNGIIVSVNRYYKEIKIVSHQNVPISIDAMTTLFKDNFYLKPFVYRMMKSDQICVYH
jgi:hypothetical protein